MKKRYRNRQNMMEVFVAFALSQLFIGLMFERLTFGEKLLFILAVSLRLFFEAIGLRPRVCRGDGVKALLDAFCLIKVLRVGCTSSWSSSSSGSIRRRAGWLEVTLRDLKLVVVTPDIKHVDNETDRACWRIFCWSA
jgi:hypothetical protein